MRAVTVFVAVALTVLAGATAEVRAQSTTSPAEEAIPDIRALSKDITDQGGRLRDDAAAALKKADELEGKMQESQKNFDLEVAKKNTNEMIANLRSARDRLSPEQTYRKALGKAESTIRDLASRAEANLDAKIREMKGYYAQTLAELMELQRAAEETRNQLTVEIDRFEKLSDRMAFTRTIAGIEAFMQHARAYLESMRSLGARMRGVGNTLENFGQNPPTD